MMCKFRTHLLPKKMRAALLKCTLEAHTIVKEVLSKKNVKDSVVLGGKKCFQSVKSQKRNIFSRNFSRNYSYGMPY